jgi:hypothetical protein
MVKPARIVLKFYRAKSSGFRTGIAQLRLLKILASPIKRSRSRSCDCKIIAETGASGIASMGKVMGLASANLAEQPKEKQFLH